MRVTSRSNRHGRRERNDVDETTNRRSPGTPRSRVRLAVPQDRYRSRQAWAHPFSYATIRASLEFDRSRHAPASVPLDEALARIFVLAPVRGPLHRLLRGVVSLVLLVGGIHSGTAFSAIEAVVVSVLSVGPEGDAGRVPWRMGPSVVSAAAAGGGVPAVLRGEASGRQVQYLEPRSTNWEPANGETVEIAAVQFGLLDASASARRLVQANGTSMPAGAQVDSDPKASDRAVNSRIIRAILRPAGRAHRRRARRAPLER